MAEMQADLKSLRAELEELRQTNVTRAELDELEVQIEELEKAAAWRREFWDCQGRQAAELRNAKARRRARARTARSSRRRNRRG